MSAMQRSLFESYRNGEQVYFQTDGEFIKIGRTARPEYRRRKENQTGNARPIHTLAVIPNASESAIARRFQADHVRGEWYRVSDDLTAFISAWNAIQEVIR